MSRIKLVRLQESELLLLKEIYDYYILNSTAVFHLHPLSLEELRESVPVCDLRYHSFLIKTEADEVCGFCYISKFKPKQAFDITVELTIYLKPEFAGKGFGYEAMQMFEPLIREAGFSNIVGLITGENDPSIHLFEKCGYMCCGNIRQVAEKFGRRLDLLMYQKLL